MLVFAASGKLVSAFARNKEVDLFIHVFSFNVNLIVSSISTIICDFQVVMSYHGHKQEVRLLLPLGDHLISADSGGDVIVWDVQGGGE